MEGLVEPGARDGIHAYCSAPLTTALSERTIIIAIIITTIIIASVTNYSKLVIIRK